MTSKLLQKSRSAGLSQSAAQAWRQFGKSRAQAQFVEDEFAALSELANRDKNIPITDIIKNAPTPSAMLQAARDAGKTDAEINAFAATQPAKPVAIKGRRVFVMDCFGRVFGMDNFSEADIMTFAQQGVPYTPYSNRKERRVGKKQKYGRATTVHFPPAPPAPPAPRATPMERALVEVDDVAKHLGVDRDVVLRVMRYIEAGAKFPGVDVWHDVVEGVVAEMTEAALLAPGTKSDKIRAALDVLDAENKEGVNPPEKAEALGLFLDQVDNEKIPT